MSNTMQPAAGNAGESGGVAQRLRALPGWLIVAALALVLAGAGYLVYARWFAAPAVGEEIDVGQVRASRPWAGRRAAAARATPAPPKDGVNPAAGGMFRVQSGEFFMQLSAKHPVAEPAVFYSKNDLLPRDQFALLNARRRALSSSAEAKLLNLSTQQLEQLGKIPLTPGQGLKVDPADRRTLGDQWNAYLKAPAGAAKKSAEAALLASLKEIGARALPITRQDYAHRADEVRQVLTPQQIEQLTK